MVLLLSPAHGAKNKKKVICKQMQLSFRTFMYARVEEGNIYKERGLTVTAK